MSHQNSALLGLVAGVVVVVLINWTLVHRSRAGQTEGEQRKADRTSHEVPSDAANSGPEAGRNEEATWLDVFAAYPGARKLCSQHITGTTMHILWSAYVTSDMPEKVISYYRRTEAAEHVELHENSLSIRRGAKILSVHSTSAKTYPDCGAAPGPLDNTIIIVSQGSAPPAGDKADPAQPAAQKTTATQDDRSRSIGTATMEDNGTIILNLRAEGPGPTIGDAQFVYPRGHKKYERILQHLGGLKKGQSKPVPPWPD